MSLFDLFEILVACSATYIEILNKPVYNQFFLKTIRHRLNFRKNANRLSDFRFAIHDS